MDVGRMIEMPGTSYRDRLPSADGQLQSLAGELHYDVTKLAVDIGERNVRHRPQQLAEAADWLENVFRTAEYAPRRQTYEVSGIACHNLEVEILGCEWPQEIVVVGAHYDTVIGSPGANDNTSGVAATLALARGFVGRRTARTVRFVAFVNEESPYAHTEQMGSRVYARRCRERGENIVAMMSLETIGYYDDRPGSQKYPPPIGQFYPSAGDFIGFVGNLASADLVRHAVGAFRSSEPFPCEGAALPEEIVRIGDSDHASFWHEGYPALMVTDTANFRYPYYHMPEDTIDKVNFDCLARVVRGLETVVAKLADAGCK